MPDARIDLRSDTVTRPTREMREAMAAAEVGDDVYGEDPTVERLQKRAAEILEKEAALFVPSGTMGNQIAIRLHTRPGEEIVTEERGHVFNYEMAATAAISGVLARPVRTVEGIMTWPQIQSVLAPGLYYRAQTSLITLENPHNMAGGTLYPVEEADEICRQAHARGLPVHLDGARIFNAAVSLGVAASRLCREFDSIMFCLSKGLGAPVGSMVLGNRDFIDEARSVRKMLGGGMRQVGILAAAGVIALEKMPSRLSEDHAHARLLSEKLAPLPGLEVHPEKVCTNIVIVRVAGTGMDSIALSARLKDAGVLVGVVDSETIRLLTHFDVTEEQVRRAADLFRTVLENRASP